MKKELLIVILVVMFIIAISALLKYVIFKDYVKEESNFEPKRICYRLCREARFETGRCGYSSCNQEEKMISPQESAEAIKIECGTGFKTDPALPGLWVCCCGN
jgi:hypothetical protein